MKNTLFLAFAILILFSGSALAVNCHCFNQRDYDPASPASADPYILATASNSLLAGSLGAEKSAVVKLRMGGAEEADVWLGLHGAKAAGKEAALFFEAREKAGSWSKAYKSHNFSGERFGGSFITALAKDEAAAARVIAGLVLAASFPAERDSIPELEKAGATIGEATVALFLKKEGGRDPIDSFRKLRDGSSTWGTLLHELGLTPKMVSPRIMALARPPA